MVDISELKNYLIDESNDELKDISYNNAEAQGIAEYIRKTMDMFLDCTKPSRLIQTNDMRYKLELSRTVNLIHKLPEDEQDNYFSMLLDVHKKNLEFEAVNGFAYDINSNKRNKVKQKKTIKHKQLSLDGLDDKLEKHEVHKVKLNKLMFKI